MVLAGLKPTNVFPIRRVQGGRLQDNLYLAHLEKGSITMAGLTRVRAGFNIVVEWERYRSNKRDQLLRVRPRDERMPYETPLWQICRRARNDVMPTNGGGHQTEVCYQVPNLPPLPPTHRQASRQLPPSVQQRFAAAAAAPPVQRASPPGWRNSGPSAPGTPPPSDDGSLYTPKQMLEYTSNLFQRLRACRSTCFLRNKGIEFVDFLEEKSIDTVIITETHLKPEMSVFIPNHRLVRLDRTGFEGRGVTIALRHNMNCRLLPSLNDGSATALRQDITKLTRRRGRYIIAGDLNAKHESWGTPEKTETDSWDQFRQCVDTHVNYEVRAKSTDDVHRQLQAIEEAISQTRERHVPATSQVSNNIPIERLTKDLIRLRNTIRRLAL